MPFLLAQSHSAQGSGCSELFAPYRGGRVAAGKLKPPGVASGNALRGNWLGRVGRAEGAHGNGGNTQGPGACRRRSWLVLGAAHEASWLRPGSQLSPEPTASTATAGAATATAPASVGASLPQTSGAPDRQGSLGKSVSACSPRGAELEREAGGHRLLLQTRVLRLEAPVGTIRVESGHGKRFPRRKGQDHCPGKQGWCVDRTPNPR